MPNNRPRHKHKRPGANQQLHQDLKSIEQTLANQNTRSLPSTLDPMEMKFVRRHPHNFSRVTLYTSITYSSTLAQTYGFLFALNLLPNYNDFTNLFDEYRILQCKVAFTPRYTATNVNVPALVTTIDHDEATVPTSKNELLQYETVMSSPGGQLVERVVSPVFASNAYGSGFGSYSRAPHGTWISTLSPEVQHYGVKYWVDIAPSALNNVLAYEIFVTYYLQFREGK